MYTPGQALRANYAPAAFTPQQIPTVLTSVTGWVGLTLGGGGGEADYTSTPPYTLMSQEERYVINSVRNAKCIRNFPYFMKYI
jgi:hypothetical protein